MKRRGPEISALVLAGGRGTRLHPLTLDVPKPMLEVGGEPLLARSIRRLRRAGIRRIFVATHYHQEKIKRHFGEGAAWGCDIQYIEELRPLGTAGSLALLRDIDTPVMVMNGDILTALDFSEFATFHQTESADVSMVVWRHSVSLPYGVVTLSEESVSHLSEKPTESFWINAGIYCIEPQLLRDLPTDRPLQMPDLVQMWIERGKKIAAYITSTYWRDIGNAEDYLQAQEDFRKGVLRP
jgi:NDP-sugar pyrophosphorylase family protein